MATRKPLAVVVGVGPGLGVSLAKRFAAGGYSVGLIARSGNSLQPIQKELEQKAIQVIFFCFSLSVKADASDISSLKDTFKTIRTKFGNDPEVLLYNAGRCLYKSILDLKPGALQTTLNVTAVGALVASQEVLPAMVKNSKGTILFTGATASLRGGAKFGAFAASKFAVRALAQSMAREFSPQGVHVAHVIIDGQINTPRQVQMQPDKDIDSFLNSDTIAETYWQLHVQPRSTWTHELDLCPLVEKF